MPPAPDSDSAGRRAAAERRMWEYRNESQRNSACARSRSGRSRNSSSELRVGLPRRAMRMTVVIDEKGEGHAVLTLITDRGDLILDNKTNVIVPWHKTGYVFIKRESQDITAWVSLGGVTSPVTTANR